nr:MAG TPA: hypothetical protein [Caudoviricetes sp.]
MDNPQYLDDFYKIPTLTALSDHIQTMIDRTPFTFSIVKYDDPNYLKYHIRYHDPDTGKRRFIGVLTKDPKKIYHVDDFDMQIQMRRRVVADFNIAYTIKNGGKDVIVDADRWNINLHFKRDPEEYKTFDRYLGDIIPKWSKHEYPDEEEDQDVDMTI